MKSVRSNTIWWCVTLLSTYRRTKGVNSPPVFVPGNSRIQRYLAGSERSFWLRQVRPLPPASTALSRMRGPNLRAPSSILQGRYVVSPATTSGGQRPGDGMIALMMLLLRNELATKLLRPLKSLTDLTSLWWLRLKLTTV